jgi:hypothetical protein
VFDKKAGEIEAKAETDRMKMEIDYTFKSQLEREKMQTNAAQEAAQAEADMVVRQQELAAEIQKMQAELVLKREEMQMKMELERQKAELMAKAKRTAKITRGPDGKAQSIEIGG